jgi:hypothetical protein
MPNKVIRTLRYPFDRLVDSFWLSQLPPVEPVMVRSGCRIAVVGNGPLQAGYGDLIDDHDIVLRFNTCRSYHRHGGTRTDILVLISGGVHAKMFAHVRGHIPLECLMQVREFWFVHRADRRSYAEDIVRRRVGQRPWRYISSECWQNALSMLRAHGAAAEYSPSSGLLTLCYIREAFPPTRVTLFGFSHEGTGCHAWDAEKGIVDSWSDWITRATFPERPLRPPSRQRPTL